ncbi:MAG: hypothetical protein DWQ07_09735 [Chloroflexi bacterium]|nr:MAG: hypothetical protein DWQ07_09735 [Chloroflexota bacterium]MBL1193006.1 hypothetical protein [Chloroflexota bacterium]NOH10299.1 hypothetical protein [Chloroflexota bacterium]
MLRSPIFWFILILAIIVDGILIAVWRRRRGLSMRPQSILQDTLSTPKNLQSRIKAWIATLRNPKPAQAQPTTVKPPAIQAPELDTLSPSNFSKDTYQRLLWQLVLPFGLASIPVWLVFKDRWMGDAARFERVRTVFCSVEAFCDLRLPPYFPLILIALLALFLIMRLASKKDVSVKNLGLNKGPAQDLIAMPISDRQRRWAHRLIFLAMLCLVVVAARTWRYGNGQSGAEYAVLYVLLLMSFALHEVSLTAIGKKLKEHGKRWTSMILAHLALIWLLVSIYDTTRTPWLALVATALAYLTVWPYRNRVSPTFWITSLALLVYTLYINAWWTSIAGDDYAFLNDALMVLEQPWVSTSEKLFLGAFTYGSHPYLTNIIQAAFMKLLGVSNFAWRFSSIYVAVMTLPFFFGFLKNFLQERVAVIITILLTGSHYIIAFSRIGYNNMQALFVTALMLYLAAKAIQSSGLWSYAALGAAIGLSFYAFPGALLTVPVPFLLLLTYKGLPSNWQAIKQWGTTAFAALLLISPLFSQPLYWTSKLPGSFLTSTESANPSALFHSFSNFIYALISPLYFIEESHFVVVGYMDVISAGFFFLGLSYLVWRWREERFLLFMLVSFAFMLLAVGVIHNYITPPATRMFMLLPWQVFFAGVGILWLFAQIQRLGFSDQTTRGMINICVVLVLCVNVYQGYRLSFERSGRYQHFITMQLGVLQDFFSQPKNVDHRIVIMNDAVSMNVPIFERMLNLYQVPVDKTRFQIVSVFGNPSQPNILTYEEAIPLFDDENALIMVNPGVAERAPQLAAEYEAYLQSIGKQRCDVYSFIGDLRFWFWYSPELEEYCPLDL